MGYPFIPTYSQLEMIHWAQGSLVTWGRGVTCLPCCLLVQLRRVKHSALHNELYYRPSCKSRHERSDKYKWSREI